MKIINSLQWRYATKKFNADKKIPKDELNNIKEAIRLSPTSYGLQLFKVLDIEDKEIREKLKEAAWGQSQITDASNLFVFCAFDEVKDSDIDAYIKLKAETTNTSIDDLKNHGDSMKNAVSSMGANQQMNWTSKQTYITLSSAILAAAEQGIDVCPMEGFDSARFDEILNLKEKGLTSAVIATLGYRSEDDALQNQAKTRKSKEVLFEHI